MKILTFLLCSATVLPSALLGKEKPLSYNLDIRPILSDRCFVCHGFDKHNRKADLRLDRAEESYSPLEKGKGSAIVPGKPEQSVAWQRIISDDSDEVMPPADSNHTLSDKEKALIKRWITEGATYEKHWSFMVPVRPDVPEATAASWGENSIDKFILARMDGSGLTPSKQADKRTLIRRVYLDMIGLPPSIDEVDAFLNDNNDDAYKKVVDQLLDSDHYGERMALPWLDAARYSDSNGFQGDGDRFAWPWRDWLIKVLNDNKPFNEFVIEMLAGDLLPNPGTDQLVATAFNRNHMINGEGGAIAEESRFNYVIDRVDTTATTFLGLTMACAQCHDHKFDPLTQKEFYQFSAFFDNIDDTKVTTIKNSYHRYQVYQPYHKLPVSKEIQESLDKLTREKNELDIKIKLWARGLDNEGIEQHPKKVILLLKGVKIESTETASIQKLRAYYVSNVSDKPRDNVFLKELSKLNTLRDQTPHVMIMKELKDKRKTFIHPTGTYDKVDVDPLTGAIPAVLGSLPAGASRLSLAQWLMSAENPLTARVTVNRYWQSFFGRGIVKTPEDFGFQGAWPSHPLLLDWLAVEFHESGWDVKHIHRLIVSSATYRQDSHFTHKKNETDPENILFSRGKRYRMNAMLIRDQALAVSGLLNAKLYGRPVYPYQPDRMWSKFSLEKFSYPTSKGEDLFRRSIYTFWRRTVAPPTLFDMANRQTCVVTERRTNTPLHALTMLNEIGYVEAARVLATNVAKHEDNPDAQIDQLFQRSLLRMPSTTEKQVLKAAYHEEELHYRNNPTAADELINSGESPSPQTDNPVALAALTNIAMIILNLDEFVTLQ